MSDSNKLLTFCGLVCICLLMSFGLGVESAYPLKILGLFPHPGMSHFQFFQPLMRGLAEAGHDVTVISHFPDKSPPARYKDLPLEGIPLLKESVDLSFFEKRSIFAHLMDFFLLHEWGKDSCNFTLRSNAMQQVLKKKNYYNIIIMEQFCSDCMTAVAHVLNVPFISMSSCALMPWHYERFGVPHNPAFIPNLWLSYSENMSFTQRLGNWLSYHALNLMHKYIDVPATDALVRYKFGHDLPSVGDLAKETSLAFVNQHYSLSGAKPLPPSVIEIGGIHIQKSKPLDAELQKFADNAEHGLVVISWGHMIRADTLSPTKREAILRAIRRLKQRVIWKWENDTMANTPSNLLITKWLPQRDILCHPNVKVFMSHAGLLGSSEAAYCGVPVVATPQYGDQFMNAAAMVHRGMAVLLPTDEINENSVIRAIKKVLEKSYQDKAKAVSHEYNHRSQTSLQKAIWWVEHVAHTKGAPLLKSTAAYMSPLVYNSVDVQLFVFGILFLCIISWIWLLRKLFGHKKTTQDKTKKD